MGTFLFWFALLSSFCSITGITVLSMYKFFATKARYSKVQVMLPYVIFVTILCLISALLAWSPWNKTNAPAITKIVYVDSSGVKNAKTDINRDTPSVHKTSNNSHPLLRLRKPAFKKLQGVDTPKSQSKKDTQKASSQYSLPNATFNAPSQFGNGNNQYNFGKFDRMPLTGEVNQITSWLPDKNRAITIQFESPDAESKKYSEALENMLDKRGYKNITFFSHLE